MSRKTENEKFQDFFSGFLRDNGKWTGKRWEDMTDEERTAETLRLLQGGKKMSKYTIESESWEEMRPFYYSSNMKDALQDIRNMALKHPVSLKDVDKILIDCLVPFQMLEQE